MQKQMPKKDENHKQKEKSKHNKEKRISKEIHEVEAAKKVALNSAKNVANKYDGNLQTVQSSWW